MNCDKAWFVSETAAKAEMLRIRSRRVTTTWKLPIRVYACPYCTGWHMTSQPDKKAAQR